MVTEQIEYQFITIDSPHYFSTINLRHDAFFRPSGTQIGAVADSREGRSMHLIAMLDDEVVGYIRLTMEGREAHLSQFVVAPQMQGKAGLAKNLYDKATARAKELGAKKVSGEIRLPMAGIAVRLGYNVSNNVSPSANGTPQRHAEKDL